MKRYTAILLSAAMLLCGFNTAAFAEGDTLVGKWQTPEVAPPANMHPRIYFTAEDIPAIKNNIQSEENQTAYQKLTDYINYTVTATEDYSAEKMAAIEGKAFYYAVFGDRSVGYAAVEGIDAIRSVVRRDAQDITRVYGRMINVLSEVYDWCYDLLSDEQKQDIISLCTEIGSDMEIGWPPSKQGAVTGHGSEMQLLRDYLSFAIAVYDERPDIWNYIGGRFYEEYVPVRQFTGKGNYNHQGTNYGAGRDEATAYAYMLITGMGAEEPYPIADLAGSMLSRIYMKRPDGNIFYDGDIYSNRKAPFDYFAESSTGVLICAAKAENGYLKSEYLKMIQTRENGKTVQSYGDLSPVLHLILCSPDISAKPTETLPLSRYMGTPYGIMTARTSWQEGSGAKSAAAVMKIGEYMFNNHQHLDSGNFEIYYKGLLAAEGGNYDLYGTEEHNMYTSKSVAHNTMLVYDPNEVRRDSDGNIINDRSNINDGGQRAVYGYREALTLGEVTDGMKHAAVTAHEIDPRHTQKPEYTYLKGNLTDAYTDKVSDYTRSFMFLDTQDDEVPAAMLVFDRVTASDKTFKKTWLLHSTAKPKIGATAADFNLDGGEYSGKMRLETLLPKSDNLSMTAIGGEEGFGVVNQYKYNGSGWSVTESRNYATEKAEGTESNTYRLEVSPKTAAQTDCFLNVITVGDDAGSIKVSAPLIETEDFYGTVIKDRAVFFERRGERAESFFAALPNGSYKYTVCDMRAGEYAVSVSGKVMTEYVSEDGGVLAFEGGGGAISAQRVGGNVVPYTDEPYVTDSDAVYVKSGKVFRGTGKLNDGEYAAADALSDVFGYTELRRGNRSDLYRGTERIAGFTLGSSTAVTRGGEFEMTSAAVEDSEGRLTLPLADLCRALAFSGTYVPYARTLYIDGWSDADYKTDVTAYSVGNDIRVNARINSRYTARLICGAFDKSGVLISACPMTDRGNGRFTAELSGMAAENVTLRVFKWTEDGTPFAEVSEPKSYSSRNVFNQCGTAIGNMDYRERSGGLNVNYGAETRTLTVTKTGTGKEPWIRLKTNGRVLGEGGYLMFSTAVRINKKSTDGEYLQLRLRSSAAQPSDNSYLPYLPYRLPSDAGDEYRLGFIVDVANKIGYIYIDGELKTTYNMEKWVNADGTPASVFAADFYFIGSEGKSGGEVELFDSFAASFGAWATFDEVKDGMENLWIK